MCTLVIVCDRIARIALATLTRCSGQMVRLYGAEVSGIRPPGQMGRDASAPEVAG